ncbi:hypothetical protein G7072_10660 [Nocardioides sp. HDW12B]|uniref:hypothetical protein n=1 Tax=Nocardioides sp. HDW12B TaxID=2714939 RepID=UPI00140785C5|nr:hypothetical protein [Nocardioides sp. HDW12B]QIK66738.1 hypothetical protein G7072_10660 [Nocardioides sp. HDW12B]
MHPSIEYPALQQHFNDLHREAAERRRHRLVPAPRRRQHASEPITALSPSMHRVLVFAEHDPSPTQLDELLRQLAALRDDTVTMLVHHRSALAQPVTDELGQSEIPSPARIARIPAQRGRPASDRGLLQAVDALHGAGHRATGEVVSGSASRVLVDAVNERHPEAVILLTEQHRLAHLAHRDLEHQLLARTDARVLTLIGA